MNRISIYFFYFLIYIGLYSALYGEIENTVYIDKISTFQRYFPEGPVSLILKRIKRKGLAIKTNLMTFAVVIPFTKPREITVSTSRDLWRKNRSLIGLSLFTITDDPTKPILTPHHPIAPYINNHLFGSWVTLMNGERKWLFYGHYQSFRDDLAIESSGSPWEKEWGPSDEFFRNFLRSLENETPFYGDQENYSSIRKFSKISSEGSQEIVEDGISFEKRLSLMFSLPRRR